MIHPLCSGDTCHAQAAEIAHLRQQLATAQGERDTARAQLVQAQAAAQKWREAYAGMAESAAFHLEGFERKCREVR